MPSVEDAHSSEPYCYLTTTGRHSGEPREIEIWFAAFGDSIVLMNGGGRRPPGESDWVRNIRADPAVTVRIGGQRYRGRARLVPFDGAEHEAARERLIAKYETAPGELADWRATAVPVFIDLEPV